MFLGHYGLALAAKRVAPNTSLGTAVLATQLADFLWPLFLLLGWERVTIAPGITKITPFDFVFPWSHSLLMDLLWASGLAVVYFLARRNKAGTLVVFFGVLSHWVLDWIAHRPDMPLTPWSAHKYGLGLWNSVSGTVVVEFLLFFAGLAIYARQTEAKDRAGSIGLWSFAAVLAIIWLGATFGPPPPNAEGVGYSAFALWLTAPWAYWIDKHRRTRNLVSG